MDWGRDFIFLFDESKLGVCFIDYLVVCGFQERLFDMSMPRCVATSTTGPW